MISWPLGLARPSSKRAVAVPPSVPGYQVWSTDLTFESQGRSVGTERSTTTAVLGFAPATALMSAIVFASIVFTAGVESESSPGHAQSAITTTLDASRAAVRTSARSPAEREYAKRRLGAFEPGSRRVYGAVPGPAGAVHGSLIRWTP